jgi:glutamate synthase domain-containing protein 3
MAKLGYSKLEDMIGQTQHLEVNKRGLHYKSRGLDLSPLLTPASELNPSAGVRNLTTQEHNLHLKVDNKFIEQAKDALENKTPVVIEGETNNLDRTLGTILSYEISKRYGAEGLPDNTIHLKLKGHGAQSMGFTLAKGIKLTVEGDANDYIGKGLSGGVVAVYPSQEVIKGGFKADEHVVVGNVCLYGATHGKAFFSGKAGERFCVRNSGAIAVVEGVGDHGCEYMTGGVMVCLGSTGRNFAAGMSGGLAYVYDPDGKFPERCNMGLVGLESIETAEEKEEVYNYIKEHVELTQSAVGQEMLDNWDTRHSQFVKVFPHDFKRVLQERAAAAEGKPAAA